MTNQSSNEWGFVVRDLETIETQNYLRSILRQETCVPFIGAGFTGGEKARTEKVPRGAEWMKIMRQQIEESAIIEKPSPEELAGFGFQDLSDIYFRENIVSLDIIKESVNAFFTKVEIDDASKKNFLAIDWPYVYTLNIDDGIERLIDGVKVLPYKPFLRHSDRRYVYKLHGDAEDVLTAANRDDLQVIFGKADYIKSLDKNQYLISNLTNDFAEKNILFIGCSLSDELDISFALANVRPEDRVPGNARIFVTSSNPVSYAEKKKLKSYGITDVIVGDYSMFYNLAASAATSSQVRRQAIDKFVFPENTIPFTNDKFAAYLLQSGWKHGDSPYAVSIARTIESSIHKCLDRPLVVLCGRRFSGKTTLLYRILAEARTRQRFLIPSQSSMNDKTFNDIFETQDAIIAIDSGALHHDQLRVLARKADRLRENNSTVLLALSRAELNALGSNYIDEAIGIDARFNFAEISDINKLLDPLGFQRWNAPDSILDNIFFLGSSPVVNSVLRTRTKLDERITAICTQGRGPSHISAPSKLEFATLFYLAVRQRMFSFAHRTLTKRYGLPYMADTHIEDFARKWAPFIEWESADSVSRQAENSSNVLICNSYAWTQFALRTLSNKLGLDDTAAFIVELYSVIRSVDEGAFQLILFDNLNSVYGTKALNEKDWGARVITAVYEKLAPVCAQEPDYWLQRAKGTYYLSNNPDEIRIGIAYCEKGIVEKAQKTWVNAKLTKANLLGKLCDVTDFSSDEDLSRAISAYVEAIGDRHLNPTYIDDLLRKNKHGKGYMNKVCAAARTRAALLKQKHDIRFIEEYASR